ncbi:MAG: hypothetical protein EOO43_26265 [Flavobacterium sp.]|nr:MAG: hypothetical protein EOO43_26265 [Flavobacterium sp.]
MTDHKGNIDISRHNGHITIAAMMPSWDKRNLDNEIIVDLPLLNIQTNAYNEDDAIIAREEVLKCFFIAAERFGNGIEEELIPLGWNIVKSDGKNTQLEFNVPENDAVFVRMFETGEEYVTPNLEIEELEYA